MCDLAGCHIFATFGNSDTGDIICMSIKELLCVWREVLYDDCTAHRIDNVMLFFVWMYFQSRFDITWEKKYKGLKITMKLCNFLKNLNIISQISVAEMYVFTPNIRSMLQVAVVKYEGVFSVNELTVIMSEGICYRYVYIYPISHPNKCLKYFKYD